METKVWTVMDVRNWAVPYLTKAHVDSPRKTIEMMMCSVLHTDKLGLYMQFERILSSAELATLRDMIDRRVRKREPLQYIIGSTFFHGLEICVDPRVLIPRPETEQLVEHAVRILREQRLTRDSLRVADIGTGSGCIALAIASIMPDVHVTAIDVSRDALDVASMNAARLNICNLQFDHRDALDSLPWSDEFDLIVSNPPYIPKSEMASLDAEVRAFEPERALTDYDDGLLFYRHYALVFPTILKPSGSFLLELGYGMAEETSRVFREWNTKIHKDLDGRDRILEGYRT